MTHWKELGMHARRHLIVRGALLLLLGIAVQCGIGWLVASSDIAQVRGWVWPVLLAVQVLWFIAVWLFVRGLQLKSLADEAGKLHSAAQEIQRSGHLTTQVHVNEHSRGMGGMAKAVNDLVDALQSENKRLDLFAQVFHNSGEAIAITDGERNIIAVNASFVEVTGYAVEEVLGKNPRMLSSGKQSKEFYQGMWHSINDTGRWEGEIWNRRKNGEIFPEWQSIAAIRDGDGRVINYISIFHDITQNKEAERYFQYLAHYDSLTQLPNRTLFGDRLQQALATAKRNGQKVALLFLDLDHFKNVNDTLGHLSGDWLLQSVAERLRSCVRETDTVCRQGGDEFLVLLSEIDGAEHAAQVAQKIIKAMSAPHLIAKKDMIITFSIGISLYPGDSDDALTMIEHADAAMYQAKAKGRNNFQVYSPIPAAKS